MAETTLDVRSLEKEPAYALLEEQLDVLLEGIADPIAIMATMSAVLHNGFRHLWTGFYRVVEPGALLRVGPYQGTVGCLEIHFGRGVCGTAAAERRTVVVPDVEAFPGHIACDSASRSEIVVPVTDARGELIAVLDLDSDRLASFDETDARCLERMVSRLASTAVGVSSAAAAG